MTRQHVVMEVLQEVAVLTLTGLNSLNPLTDELVDALGDALKSIEADPLLHVTVSVLIKPVTA
ncbi:hypothetical protein [Polaromonas sp. JS666]|uniref:hypothetical protein n=1 Tax=Polaromonas sp. (strain JS666 / ATCC BAA-500) TaxID=296591 RepID=UPI0000465011|nr:hypothetical protein [Polaromonas sp. JS666]